MLGGMREPQTGRSGRAGLTGTLRVTTVQRDDQTLPGPPGQQRRPKQQRRQQVQSAFDQDVRHGHDGGSYRSRGPVRRPPNREISRWAVVDSRG